MACITTNDTAFGTAVLAHKSAHALIPLYAGIGGFIYIGLIPHPVEIIEDTQNNSSR